MISALLVISFMITLTACSREETVTPDAQVTDISSSSPDCIIGGKNIYFVSPEAKKEWYEPLAKLLSNVYVPYGEHGEILGYEATTDPNAPVIPDCYECGLLDVTNDGVPELLVSPYGFSGSSGNETYFVYNIYSGQKLGELTGGNGQSWCVYYNTEHDSLKLYGRYWLREGWDVRYRYIKTVNYFESTMECSESCYLNMSQVIIAEPTDVEDNDSDDIYFEEAWTESYTSTGYYIWCDEATLDDYYAEYDHYLNTCLRIPETELVLFTWDDVCDDNDSYITKGKKMASALISSEQEFVMKIS